MLEKLPRTIGHALRNARPGLDRVTLNDEAFAATPHDLVVYSTAFADGAAIPAKYTADGAKISPPLSWQGVPRGAASIVVLIEDADSPTPAPLVHAIAWNLDGRDGSLDEGRLTQRDVPMGRNSYLQAEYLPMDPPPAHGVHRYVFQVFALDSQLDLTRSPGRREVVRAMTGHVLSAGFCIGTYERP